MTADVDWENGRITDEGLDFMHSWVGRRREMRPWTSEVTRDTIWHFANGVGDDNPLWWDPDYAAKTRWGGMITQPTFLYCAHNGGQDPDDTLPFGTDQFLPGALGLWASTKWKINRPLRIGEKIKLFWELAEVELFTGSFGGRAVNQTDRNIFCTDAGEEVASVSRIIKRFERGAARAQGKYAERKLATYTAEDRARFAAQYDREQEMRRGSKPLRIADIRPGDKLGPMLKGPLTVTNLVGWLMGWGSGFCQTNRIAHRFLRNHPGSRVFNARTGIEDTIEAPHWDNELANLGGYPAGYDFGSQRISWIGHMLTDWAGDNGEVTELEVKLIRPNLMGDVTWITGSVVQVIPGVEYGEVVVSFQTENQLGETTTSGSARIRLPA